MNLEISQILNKEFLSKELETKTVSQIARDINISRDTVYYWIRKFKIKIKIISEDLSGKKFGLVTVIQYIPKQRKKDGNSLCWQCQCECGKIINYSRQQLFKTININCGCKPKLYKGHFAKTYTGIGNFSGSYYSKIQQSAKKRNLEFNITKEYIWNLFLEQKGKCSISGEPIILSSEYRCNPKTQTASLDRIDSSKGYIEGNVQWVYYRINTMKNNMTDKELINWCQKIIKYQKTKAKKE